MKIDPFALYIDESDIKIQRRKARELRATQWWKRRVAKGVCHYCSGSFSPKDLTMDHIVPVARGGKSTKGNVVPSCKTCNNTKKNLLPMEWDQYVNRM
jgi:5-methylcytosine-specific restriction endonuclease McrA